MECDICYREYDGKRLPFLCAVDARNQIYETRFKHLQVVLERDALESQISSLLDSTAQPSHDAVDKARGNQRLAEARTSHILAAADQLRNDIKAARDEIQARKASLARRRSDLASLSEGLVERRAKQKKEVEKSTQRVSYRWAQSAEEMAMCRSFLCTEAADIYGLNHIIGKEESGNTEYQIGKVPVVELRDMNALSPEVITTSLGHIAHVLMLASHYLAIRLPAEITLPHRDYPFPTIFNTTASYKHGPVPFPGTPNVTTTSALAADPHSKRLPKARPLYLHKSLSQLLKDDPAMYSYFIEGVSLLAYDIAWLCSTQGMTFSEKYQFEEICQMGRNLYTILIESQKPKPSDKGNAASSADPDKKEPNWIGRFSHGTTYYYLGGAEGTDLTRSFKLLNPSRIADQLKKKLIGDAPIPGWELLEDEAWKVEEAEPTPTPMTKETTTKGASKGSNKWSKLRS